MIITYECLECGFSGEVIETNRKVTCPNCNTVNDVWLEGEIPPLTHR